MKFLLIALCLLAAVLFVASCGGDDNGTQHDTDLSASESGERAAAVHTAPGTIEGLVLNEGKKWQMDEHMGAIINKMAATMEDVEPETLDSENLKDLGVGLKANINELVQSCSMTGDAHDQLHTFLSVYVPAVTTLEETGDCDAAEKVQHYLKIYGNYFE